MSIKEQVFAQTLLLAGDLEEKQKDLLSLLCGIAVASLSVRLKDGIRPEDCRADFVSGASLLALAALNGVQKTADVEEFKAGDLTVKRKGADAASRCLQKQAELLMGPYLKGRYVFLGV